MVLSPTSQTRVMQSEIKVNVGSFDGGEITVQSSLQSQSRDITANTSQNLSTQSGTITSTAQQAVPAQVAMPQVVAPTPTLQPTASQQVVVASAMNASSPPPLDNERSQSGLASATQNISPNRLAGATVPPPLPTATLTPLPTQQAVPLPTPHTMIFQNYGTNPFVATAQDNLSTFAIDVDTGSYTVARRYINDGLLPPPEAVRIEEFVNYFDYGYPYPTREELFAIYMDAAPVPFVNNPSGSAEMVRIGIQGYDVACA